MNYYGYIRVAAEPEEGYTLEGQRTAIEKYAKKHKLTVKNIFIDESISLKWADMDGAPDKDILSNRQGVLDLISALGKEDTVLVLNTNRLWRGLAAEVAIRRELEKRKVKVISIQQPKYDLYEKNPNDWLMERMLEMVDNYLYDLTGQHIWDMVVKGREAGRAKKEMVE